MPISIELSTEAEMHLDALACRTGRSKEFYLLRSWNAASTRWRITISP